MQLGVADRSSSPWGNDPLSGVGQVARGVLECAMTLDGPWLAFVTTWCGVAPLVARLPTGRCSERTAERSR